MPSPEVTFANRVRTDRRVGQRFAERVAKGEMKPGDVDLAAFYFGNSPFDERLEALGLLGPEMGLEKLADALASGILYAVKVSGRPAEMEERIVSAVARRQAERAAAEASGEVTAVFQNVPKNGTVTARSKANAERDQRSAIKVIAVHLIQRALYHGLSRAYLKMATDQLRAKPDRLLPHGPLQTGARVGRKRRSQKDGKLGGLDDIEKVLSKISGKALD